MKTKNEMYQMLSDEIMRSRKQAKKFKQVMIVVLLGLALLVLIALTVENDSSSTVLVIILIIALMVFSTELPLGKIQKPTKDEIIQYAKIKLNETYSVSKKHTEQIKNLQSLLANHQNYLAD